MLLPSMASSLKLSYSQIGFISTGNFIGYLIAVLICGRIAKKIGSRRLIVIALAVIGASMALISRSHSFLAVLLLYFITGMGSGAANVPVMGLITAWFDRTIRGRAAGFVVIGSGFAIICQASLSFVTRSSDRKDEINWIILAGIVIAISLISHVFLRNKPEDVGLKPLGSEEMTITPVTGGEKAAQSIYKNKTLYLLGTIYFLFGYTYVIYATFIVTTLVKERGFSETIAGNFWAWVGLLSLFSGPLFGTLSDRLGRKTGLTIVLLAPD
jgi:sugar phosphate permease